MSEPSPQPQRPGAERTGDSWFARRSWVFGVAIGLTVIGTWIAGIVGLLISLVIAGIFLVIATR
ncbi:hypothetical protein [Egicoccus halophilus]|uniref:Uncharacterized protein n=1 Tax=Egicoccus halophilus TaxID=1670830 RepID=A0A8J3EYK8_9ACTN|nr:hypothetical protein [Egicoccus halophilus]GGI08082.1 hypothetical protein GCM10011354_27320 [Egicoccus halophilus]